MSITAYGESGIFENKGDSSPLEAARDLVETLDTKLSVTNENSIIYLINRAEGAEIPIDAQTADVLKTALDLCENTEGNLDISVYPLVREWGFTTGVYRVPAAEDIDKLLKNVDYRRIRLSSVLLPSEHTASSGSITAPGESASYETNPAGTTFSVTLDKDMMIDLGAVAKGYTAEKIAELLKEKGVGSAMISLGGNIKTIGSKPDGSDWNIAIASPNDQASYIGVLKVSDMSVVTSGGYERYFEENGKHYCHIIDPSTGCPVDNGILSVTVVSKDSFLCDALSTALFVMGRDEAIDYWRNDPEFDLIIITDDEILISEGISDAFTPDSGYIKNTSAQVLTIQLSPGNTD
ncbi:MAG: FAD:protein FMN transferase [Lachnospiraceae bacterium]|nr:FAD:protein FMN transferase [Lachnospiraceae bacterium]